MCLGSRRSWNTAAKDTAFMTPHHTALLSATSRPIFGRRISCDISSRAHACCCNVIEPGRAAFGRDKLCSSVQLSRVMRRAVRVITLIGLAACGAKTDRSDAILAEEPGREDPSKCAPSFSDPTKPPTDRLECTAPLPSAQYDGTRWPSYSEKLAEFEQCSDGGLSLAGWGVSVNQCADGKVLLLATNLAGAAYYFSGETLVGTDGGGDVFVLECDGCAGHPLGTPEGVTCDVVLTRMIDCPSPDPLAVPGSCRAQNLRRNSPPGPDGPSSSEACAPGSFRCNDRYVQRCQSDGTQWVSFEDCETAALCLDDGAGGALCTPPVCEAGPPCCDGAVRQQCNADETDYEQIETCASPDRCTPDGCM